MIFYHSNPSVPVTNDSFILIGSGYYYSYNDGEIYKIVGTVNESPTLLRTKKVQAPSCHGTFSFFPEQSREDSPLIKTDFGYLRRVDDLYYERAYGLTISFVNRRIHNPANSLFMGLYKNLNIRTSIAAMTVLKEPITLTYFEEFFKDINYHFKAKLPNSKDLLYDQFDRMTVSLIPEFITHSFEVPQFFNEVFNDWYLLQTNSEQRLHNGIFLIPKALFIPSTKTREGIIHFIVTMVYYAIAWHHLHFMCDTSPKVATMSVADILGVPDYVPPKLLNVRRFAATRTNLYYPPTPTSEATVGGVEDIEDLFVFMKQFLVVFYLIPGSVSTNKTIKDFYGFLTKILGNDISFEKCNEVYPLIQSYIENLLSQVTGYATVDDLYQTVCGMFNKNQTSLTGFFLETTLVPFPVHYETPILGNIHQTLLQLFCFEAEVQKRNLKETAEIAFLDDKLRAAHLEGQIKIYEELTAILNNFIDEHDDSL